MADTKKPRKWEAKYLANKEKEKAEHAKNAHTEKENKK